MSLLKSLKILSLSFFFYFVTNFMLAFSWYKYDASFSEKVMMYLLFLVFMVYAKYFIMLMLSIYVFSLLFLIMHVAYMNSYVNVYVMLKKFNLYMCEGVNFSKF